MPQPLPHTFLFSTSLISSTLMLISASNPISMWAAFELNLLSLIPLMLLSHSKQESEAAVKYFLAQAFGSSLLLTALPTILYTPDFLSANQTAPYIILFMGLLTKLGAAPTHFWLPPVMAGSSWPVNMALTTWQKIGPLSIFSLLLHPNLILIFLCSAASALLGGISGLNQTHIIPLLAYSSIGHLGWILPLTFLSPPLASLYFFIYSLTSVLLMSICFSSNLLTLSQIASPYTSPPKSLIYPTSLLLLSLGGLPPLLGFAPKLLTLKILAPSLTLLAPFLILGSAMSLCYYLSIAFTTLLSQINAPLSPVKPFSSLTTLCLMFPLPTLLIPLIL